MEETEKIVQKVGLHTIKKVQMIASYVEGWSQKLVNFVECKELVFIDCMSNSGEYYASNNKIKGTPVRVAEILNKVAIQHPDKMIRLIFNDYNEEKIEHLRTLLPTDMHNFKIETYCSDANVLLKKIGSNLIQNKNCHILLIYDPYDASIDWDAIEPFLNCWGEIIINHMVSDSIRGVKETKSEKARNKYEKTYQESIEQLILSGNSRQVYEQRIKEIIIQLNRHKKCFIASFPFFNSKNSLLYNLIFVTKNMKGFKLFKTTAWKTFGGQSSNKKLKDLYQYSLNLDSDECDSLICNVDENCYTILNVCDYIRFHYKGELGVPLVDIWNLLDNHPIFPSEGFRKEIKRELKNDPSIKVKRDTIDFGEET